MQTAHLYSQERIPQILRYIIFINFLLSSIVFFEPAPFDVFFGLTLCVSAFMGCLRISRKMIWPTLLLLLYLGISFISFPFSYDLERASIFFAITVYLALLSLFIMFSASYNGTEVIELISKSCLVSISISIIIAVLSYAGILPFGDIVTYGGYRIKGFFKDPNVFGPAVIFSLIYAFHLYTSGRRKLVSLIFIMICMAGVFLSYSRAAWGTSMIALFTFFAINFFSSGSRINIVKILFGVSSVAILFLVFIVAIQFFDMKSFIEDRFGMKSYDEHRFLVQEIMLEQSFAHPFGIGPGQTEIMLTQYFSDAGSGAAHNSYIRIIAENGFLAAGMFFCFMLLTLLTGLRLSLKKWQHSRLMCVSTVTLLAYTITGFVVDTIHWRHLWIVFGVIWGIYIVYTKQRALKTLHLNQQ